MVVPSRESIYAIWCNVSIERSAAVLQYSLNSGDVGYSVSQKNPPWGLGAIFLKRLGIFQPNFTRLLCVPIYAGLQMFIQLSATLMKL